MKKRIEIKEWRDLWKQCDAQSQPHNLCDSLKKCDEDQFPNLFVLLKLGCTLPVTSCEAERSFSALRRTMTSLRSKMGENRLAGLTLMNIHRDVHVDQELIIKQFIQNNKRKMFKTTSIMYE